MNLAWAASGAAIGLIAGVALPGAVFRLSVPSGEPDRTACPRCAAPVRGWLAVRCGQCGRGLGHPVILAISTAGVLALLAGKFAHHIDVVAFGFLGVVGVALAAIDIAVQRLPDRLTLPAIAILAGLLGVAALAAHDPGLLVRAVLGGLVLGAVFLLLALIRPGQLGGGDIKLAVLAGLALGWVGWPILVAGAALGFLLAGLAGVVLLALRRVTLRSHISFGPFLLGGTLLGLLASGTVLLAG